MDPIQHGKNAQVWIGCDLHDAQALGISEDGGLQAWQRIDAGVIEIKAEVLPPDAGGPRGRDTAARRDSNPVPGSHSASRPPE
jgi:hypothetical protein